MQKGHVLFLAGLLVIMLTIGSAIAATPKTDKQPAKAQTSWQQEWEQTLSDARKEGKVVIYAGWGAKKRALLTEAFKNKFGIDLEFVSFGRGSEMVAKVKAERVAGFNIPDVLGHGPGTLLPLKKGGLIGPSIVPRLILPEVKDLNAWRGGQLPFLDKENRTIGMMAVVQRRIMYNTNLVKQGEITSYYDLLKPQYKGKIVLNDPSISGAGVGWFADLARDIWDTNKASEYLAQLIKNDVNIVRDTRFHVETVARGKYSIGIAPTSDVFGEFLAAGAPITFVILKEGVFVGPGGGSMALAVDPPHPKATTVFVNWLLSREGQTLFSVKGEASPSFRIDVPTEGIPPILLLQPGEKYWIDSEELNLFRAKMMGVTKAVMAKSAP